MTTAMHRMPIRLLFPVILLLLAACATVPKQSAPPVQPGAEVETIQSAMAISVRAGGQSVGGQGYLIYQRPDQFHLVLLSPFGTTMFELFTQGEQLTCIIPSRDTAYRGVASDLPADHPLRSFGLMRWIARLPRPTGPVPAVVPLATSEGGLDLVTFDRQGLVTKKESRQGDRAFYSDYTVANGVTIPGVMELQDHNGYRVKITFDEPEVNQPLQEGALTPNLAGLTLLPLADFKGM